MAIKKITFTNANVTAQNDADLYYFLQGGTGILKGIKNEVKASNNANRFIFESGYISIYGRLLFVDNNTDITVPLNRTAKGYVVLDINTATNIAELTYTESTNGGYPILIQENLSTGVGHYQFAIAAYSKTSAALTPDQSFKPTYLYPHIEKQQGSSNANKVFMTDASGNFILVDTIPVSAIPATGVSVDTAKQLEKNDGTKIGADEVALKKDFNNVDNTSDMDKPISTAQQNAINKPLYNLGAFDTISGNVITRQTGYAVLNGSENWFLLNTSDNYLKAYVYFNNSYLKVAPSELPNAISNYFNFVIQTNYNQASNHLWLDATSNNSNNIGISISTSLLSSDDLLGLKSYLSQHNLILQYKLATSYTEEIIENQPLITLDSQGSQWLRSEWEKGLNVLPTQYSNNFTISGDTYINYPISKGTYTIKPTNSGVNGTIIIKDINGIDLYNQDWVNGLTFTINSDGCYIQRFWQNGTITTNIMLNEGNNPYPYQPYNGSIVREKQLNELDNNKANKSDVYTKTETDNKIDSIVAGETGLTNYYTKSETNNLLNDKANKTDVYTKTETNNELSNKANNSDLNAHTSNTSNPHNVTKAQVGLENVDNTSDSEKNVASAKILKNNDVYDFDISSGITPYSIDLNDNHVYLIYNDHWSFVLRVKRPNDNNYSQSTVCINESSSKPVWFTYQNAKLKLKTTKVVNSNTFVVVEENYNGKFNYKLLATD